MSCHGFRIVVLASGSGTNLQAILDRCTGARGSRSSGSAPTSPTRGRWSGRAAAGVETAVFPRDEYAGREARDAAMADWIEARGADLVVLAGYMQLLSPAFVGRFRNRIVNVHPALLPAFPGLDAIGQALAAGVEVTGVTVHFVDEGVDTGPVIVQREVPVPRRPRPGAAGGGDPRGRARALPGGDPHDRREAAVRIDASDPRGRRRPMSEAPADTRSEAASDGAIRVRRALISVSDKTGVADFAKSLAGLGVEILSTGGTASALREAGLEVTDVAEFTGQEEILGGRVKTLHPRLHAALLARRDDPEHMATLEREGIEPIDLVCVNLYPFEQTVAGARGRPEVAIENIDIGGPTMIRAAAKNHEGVAVVVKPESYDAVLRRAGGVAAARSPPRPATGSPTRPSPRPPATTPRSAAGSRPPTRTSPNT